MLQNHLHGFVIYFNYTTKQGLEYLKTTYFWVELFLCINLNYFKVLFYYLDVYNYFRSYVFSLGLFWPQINVYDYFRH